MLHLIQEYAASRELVSRPGFSTVAVRFIIAFTSTGKFASVMQLGEGTRGQRIPGCPQFSQPELKALGTGARHFLVDSLDCAALLTKNEDEAPDEKQIAKHNGFVSLLAQAGSVVPELSQIAHGLIKHREEIHAELRSHRAKPTDKATFAIDAGGTMQWLVNDPAWLEWYAELRATIAAKRSAKGSKKSEASEMRCLVGGDLVIPVPTHDKIKGLGDVGGHTSGDILASFKQGAFQHFGLQKAANAAMSDQAMSLYVTALNRLISESVKVADRRILYWYIGDDAKQLEPTIDPLAYLFEGEGGAISNEAAGDPGDAPESDQIRRRIQAEGSASGLLDQIATGGDRQKLHSGRYVAISLSANPTRVVIREVREGRFEQLCEASEAWRNDLRICRLNGRFLPLQSLNRLVTSTLRERQSGEDFDKWIAPASPAYTSLWNAALSPSRQNISEAVARQAYQRLRLAMLNGEIADALDDSSSTMKLRRSAYYARISLLKLFLKRRGDQPVSDQLNETADCDAYHAGRMLAVFQHIQTLSSGEPKASFLDRYYSAASTTPYQVLPRIWRIALNHLKRVQPKTLRAELTDLLSDIHSEIGQQRDFGRQLGLEDQFQFQLGFFQQQPELPTKNTVRRVPTEKGYLVRSKAEATISNLLHRVADEQTEMGVSVSYEPPFIEIAGEKLLVNKRAIKPDWIVQANKSARLIVVEHFGMRDLPGYSDRMKMKLETYVSNGMLHIDSTDMKDDQLQNAEGFLITSDETDGPDYSSLRDRFVFALNNL